MHLQAPRLNKCFWDCQHCVWCFSNVGYSTTLDIPSTFLYQYLCMDYIQEDVKTKKDLIICRGRLGGGVYFAVTNVQNVKKPRNISFVFWCQMMYFMEIYCIRPTTAEQMELFEGNTWWCEMCLFVFSCSPPFLANSHPDSRAWISNRVEINTSPQTLPGMGLHSSSIFKCFPLFLFRLPSFPSLKYKRTNSEDCVVHH